MTPGKILFAVLGLIVLATAMTISLIAAAWAGFEAMRGSMGAAAAAGVVAAMFAFLVILALLVVAGRRPAYVEAPTSEVFGLRERMMDLVREKPVTTAAVAIGVGLLAVRNPAVIAAVARAFLETRPSRTVKPR